MGGDLGKMCANDMMCKSRQCGPPNQFGIRKCHGAAVTNLPGNAVCFEGTECETNKCKTNNKCYGYMLAYNEECEDDGECASNNCMSSGKCSGAIELGKECRNYGDCRDKDARCQSASGLRRVRTALNKKNYDACLINDYGTCEKNKHFQCDSRLCKDGTCKPCTSHSDCKHSQIGGYSMFCYYGKCEWPMPYGTNCKIGGKLNSAMCQSNVCGHGNVCACRQGQNECPSGRWCNGHNYCSPCSDPNAAQLAPHRCGNR